jgi:cyclic pyranopterin phosphate synthase
MPTTPFEWTPKENLLSYEELFKFIKIAIDDGIKKIRITGGEPLLRKDLDKFIAMIYNYNNNIDLALTTNGYYLNKTAQKLKDAGLNRINVSLDTLKSDIAQKITGKDVLDKVIEGIEEANRVGLKIKINCVPMRWYNDTEIVELLDYCKDRGYPIRYIEFMENQHAKDGAKGLDSSEILNIINTKYSFEKIPKDGCSPAQYYRLGDNYEFGIIEPHQDDFCKSCNRIRLTAEGDLIPCLYFEDSLNIKDSVEANDTNKTREIISKVLANKPEKNKWSEIDENQELSSRAFYETGG